jgi:hypothetical protein
LRRVLDRLDYANVVATIALFVSLGGASYAVVALPAHSVGREQLKAGAVTPHALGFPLKAQIFRREVIPLRETHCPKAAPGVENAACEVRLTEGAPVGRMELPAAGRVAVTAIAAVEESGDRRAGGSIVRLELFVNGRRVDSSARELRLGEHVVVALQGVGPGRAGRNTVGIAGGAHYFKPGWEAADIRSVSILATALAVT